MASAEAEAALAACIDAQSLQLWTASRPVPAALGRLYLTRAPALGLRQPLRADGRGALRAQTQAACDEFVQRGRTRLRRFDGLFGRSGIAQLKVLAPDPGSRLFGGFVDPDIFVGLRLCWRDSLPFKATGQQGDIDYRTLGEELRREWDALLPGIRPIPMSEFET